MNKINRIKKGNLWYPPTQSIYRYLAQIENLGLPKTLAVLGCADGNYIIPAVKKGFEVLAIDIDKIALYGGIVKINDQKIEIIGLYPKLKKLKLEKLATIINQSYLDFNPTKTYSGVIVSESTHYEDNFKFTLDQIIEKVQSYVSIKGMILVEYLHYSNKNNDLARYFTFSRISSYFKSPQWLIKSH